MKIHELSNNTKIRLLEDVQGPPGEPIYKKGTEMFFFDLDGMYATCFIHPKMDKAKRTYPPAWTEVEIIK